MYKLLAYLYTQLKNGEAVDAQLISCSGPLFHIPESYWSYIIEQLTKAGYIEGACLQRAWGDTLLVQDVDRLRITPAGIEYLSENTQLRKAMEFLKEAKATVPFL